MVSQKDLVVLVPDRDWKQAMSSLLQRPQSFGIRPIKFDIVYDPMHDSSPEAAELLRPYIPSHRHALVFRDIHGSGWEGRGTAALRAAIGNHLRKTGWDGENVRAIVVDPELEVWLRFPSAHLRELVRQRARHHRRSVESISEITENAIESQGGRDDLKKPVSPKEVFNSLLRHYGINRSSAIYGNLAQRESVQHCKSESFNELKKILITWFGRSH